MPTISPTITISSTPGISITISVPGLSYEALLTTLGVVVYDLSNLYYYTPNIIQFFTPITYSLYDANGDQSSNKILTPINPDQYQPSEFVELKGRNIVIDGQSSLEFILLPMNSIQFIFYGKRIQNEDVIDAFGYINNFKEVEKAMGLEGFFEDSENDISIEFIPD